MFRIDILWQPGAMEPGGKCAGHGHLEFPSCYECACEFITLRKGIFQLGVSHALGLYYLASTEEKEDSGGKIRCGNYKLRVTLGSLV